MAPQTKTPKAPHKLHPDTDRSPTESTLTPHHEFPGTIRSAETDASTRPSETTTFPSPSDTLPAIQIQDLISPVGDSERGLASHTRSSGSILHYELPLQTRTLLPDANPQGLRVHRGRIYAEVQYTTTVMVAWDEGLGTYRAKLPQEIHPSGPALHFDPESNTWHIGEPPTTRSSSDPTRQRQLDTPDDSPAQTPSAQHKPAPRTEPDPSVKHVDTRYYVWDEATLHHHGYVVMHRKMRLDDTVGPPTHHAFKDDSGAFVIVQPSASRIDQPADRLPAWTDRDIWDLYGLQGADIDRFRTEAHNTGRKPQWARVRKQRMENLYLFDELRRWLGPDMDRDMFNRLLEHQQIPPARWAEKLDAVTLHRDTPVTPPPLPRLPTPGPSETTRVTPVYGHRDHYTWDPGQSNFHGYVEMQRKPGLDDSHGPVTQVAFREGAGLTVVKPTPYSIHKETDLRPFWRDVDIWNLYRIEGADIVRFRQDAAIFQKPPSWVAPREYPSLREQLIDSLRLWTNPDSPLKTKDQVIARFRPYNLSSLQLARLYKEISPTGQFKNLINDELPEWVSAQQARTRRVDNPRHFSPFLSEINDEIIHLRNLGGGTSLLKASLTEPFFQELLVHAGFKRNKHNYLYRTDIAAMFKVDDRTPFEIARPGAMVPRVVSVTGTTSEIPVSAMFSLKTAMDYANGTNEVAGTYETRVQDPLTGNESHPTTGSTSTPQAQRILFCYLLDTRNVEVVAGQDNRIYNPTRLERSPTDGKTWFPSMKMEGHVSMSSIGFTSRRVWLVNSSKTRAALVEDVQLQAQTHATETDQNPVDAIEARTRAGELNRDEYDALIDEVATAGKRVIELPAGQDMFSDDIVFPPETITL